MSVEITAEEIKAIRRRYGLSQKSFALLLGIGPASIVRYEQGSKPSKANANLIRAARHPEFMLECLEEDGHLLPEAQREHARQVTYAIVSIPTEGNVAAKAALRAPSAGQRMNEMYELTLRQEVLNEQAANIACDVMAYMISTGVDSSDEGDPLSALLRQLFEVKRAITGPECDNVEKLIEIGGYLRFVEDYLVRLRESQKVA